MAKSKTPLYEKPSKLVERDVHGRVRHAWAKEANVAKADPNCKGVWKPPPDKYVNKTPGTGLAGAVQRANAGANAAAKRHGDKVVIRDVEPDGVGPAHRVGRHHQANLQQMRELQKRKMDEVRPMTVPAMNVKQPYHVQQFFDRAAHHGDFAKDARRERARRDKETLRQPDDRTQRMGHTQHRTVQDVDCRMDDVWGVMQADRGIKRGQLAGHSYIDKAVQNVVRIYVGNVASEASSDEIKKACGLMDQNTLLCDPSNADGRIFWIERRIKDHCVIIHVPEKATADRIVKYCKSRAPRILGKLVRVDMRQHDDANMRWTDGHKPASEWAVEDRQGGTRARNGTNSLAGRGKSYSIWESENVKNFSSGLQYDINNIANFMVKHPAGSKTYPTCAEGRRRGAQKHGLVQWYPWMPAWEKGAPLLRMEWVPTPSFPGGGEGDPAMDDRRMRLAQRRATSVG